MVLSMGTLICGEGTAIFTLKRQTQGTLFFFLRDCWSRASHPTVHPTTALILQCLSVTAHFSPRPAVLLSVSSIISKWERPPVLFCLPRNYIEFVLHEGCSSMKGVFEQLSQQPAFMVEPIELWSFFPS
jgi:hypothetical protein